MAIAYQVGWGDGEGANRASPEEYDFDVELDRTILADESARDKAYNKGYRQGLAGKPCVDRLDIDYLEGWDDGVEELRKAGG